MAVFSAWVALDAKAMQAGPSAWKRLGQRFPGLVDDTGGVQVGAWLHGPGCPLSAEHPASPAPPPGLMQGGCGVIKVDHGLTTFPAFSIFSAMTYILVTPPTASFSVMP